MTGRQTDGLHIDDGGCTDRLVKIKTNSSSENGLQIDDRDLGRRGG